MTIIQLEVEDRLIEALGVKTVKKIMENQLAVLRLQYLGEKIAEHIRQSGADHNKELSGNPAQITTKNWRKPGRKHGRNIKKNI